MWCRRGGKRKFWLSVSGFQPQASSPNSAFSLARRSRHLSLVIHRSLVILMPAFCAAEGPMQPVAGRGAFGECTGSSLREE